jgi:hypothetical protein
MRHGDGPSTARAFSPTELVISLACSINWPRCCKSTWWGHVWCKNLTVPVVGVGGILDAIQPKADISQSVVFVGIHSFRVQLVRLKMHSSSVVKQIDLVDV